MLYVSTRNRTDAFTAYRAIHQEQASDGGVLVPFHMQALEHEALRTLLTQPFGQIVARVLNYFFPLQLTGWDVEFCIGRFPVKLKMMDNRVILGETWHNAQSTYRYLEQNLYARISATHGKTATFWASNVIRTAVLFGLFGELASAHIYSADVSVAADDLSMLLAVWYAKRMGLGIGTILCGCDENSVAWDLLNRGEFHTNALKNNDREACGVEQVIYELFGANEAKRYLHAYAERGIYEVDHEIFQASNHEIYVAVVGKTRTEFIAKQNQLDLVGAKSYGALQDYRAHKGENRPTLLFTEKKY